MFAGAKMSLKIISFENKVQNDRSTGRMQLPALLTSFIFKIKGAQIKYLTLLLSKEMATGVKLSE